MSTLSKEEQVKLLRESFTTKKCTIGEIIEILKEFPEKAKVDGTEIFVNVVKFHETEECCVEDLINVLKNCPKDLNVVDTCIMVDTKEIDGDTKTKCIYPNFTCDPRVDASVIDEEINNALLNRYSDKLSK